LTACLLVLLLYYQVETGAAFAQASVSLVWGGAVMTNSSPRLLIKDGTLIDGSGRDPVRNTLLVVDGDRISHLGPGDGSFRPESPDDTVIDAAGKFILPGLIDAHCHISLHQGALPGVRYTSSAEFCTLWAAHAIGRVLRAGVTSIAVPGGKWFTDVTVREAVEGGLLQGPRMVVAGRALGNYGGIFDPDPYPAYDGTRPMRRASCATRGTSSSAKPASNANAGSI
jgi:imidazolonepropionase-like amidohydrolase